MNANAPADGGQLYIVSTPIGNPDDITFRAVAVLRSVDAIVCEERKQAMELLRYHDIDKPLIELNEHNDTEATIECVKLLTAGKKLALISDAGTPLLADPGEMLVAAALKYGYPVHVVPGPSSILTALVRSGFSTEQFLYAGFLSRKKEQRYRQVQLLALEPRTIILLDTPYRLNTVLSVLSSVMPQRRAYIGCNLTMENESHHYGTVAELTERFAQQRFRGEYVIVIEGNPDARRWYAQLNEGISAAQNGASLQTLEEGAAEQSEALAEPVEGALQRQHSRGSSKPSRQDRPLHHRPRQQNYRGRSKQQPYHQEGSRYDHEQPIVNYTLSNPYQQQVQRRSEQQALRPYRRHRKRWHR